MPTFESKCPLCNAVFQAEAEWVGQIGECPGCGKEIKVEMPIVEQKVLTLKKKPADISGNQIVDSQSVVLMETDEKICPYCGETIKRVAVKCRFCQSELTSREPVVEKKLQIPAEQPLEYKLKKTADQIKNVKPLTKYELWAVGVAGVIILVFIIAGLFSINYKSMYEPKTETVENNVHNPYQYEYDLGRKWAKEAVNMDDGNKACYYLKGIQGLSNSFDPYEEQKKDAFAKGWNSVE